VILFNVTEGIGLEPLSYNWANYELTVDPATSNPGDTLDIYVTGAGGGNQLLRETYLGSELIDGNKIIVPFPTSTVANPPVDSIYEFVIYNGELPLVNGVDYTYASSGENKTTITFTNTYNSTNRINLTALGYGYTGQTYSYSLPVFETIIVTDPTLLTYTLSNSMQGTNPINLVILINGSRITPYEGIRYVGNGSTTTYALPDRGGYSPNLVANNDVSVYVDNQPLIDNVDYVLNSWDGITASRTITILNGAPATGSVILIGVRTLAQAWVTGNQLAFRADMGISLNTGDIIEIVSWNDTREQDILTQVFVGPPGVYDTGREIITPERILVTLDGSWLFYGDGFTVNGTKIEILQPQITSSSVVAITNFTQFTVPDAMAFRIFQDMRGVQLTYRITEGTTTTLTQNLLASDDIIHVANALALPEPDFNNNIWGSITIGAERILYRHRDTTANTLSGLLRGTAGTADTAHTVGNLVYSLGPENLLNSQYQNYVVSNTTVSDGSTAIFTAPNIDLSIEDPAIRNQSLEVYIGGYRVTTGYSITALNPCTVEFATIPPEGFGVTLLVRRGVTWYHPGAGTPSDGNPLQITDTIAARFLRGQ